MQCSTCRIYDQLVESSAIMIKVTHLSNSDIGGGAGRAAYRIHECLSCDTVRSRMLVNYKLTSDRAVITTLPPQFSLYHATRRKVANLFRLLQHTSNTSIHDVSIFPGHVPFILNKSDCDIVHLHWIQAEMLSIEDIVRIQKPLIWTLHDMWPFCGAEHYADGSRYTENYSSESRPQSEFGVDINRLTWFRKSKAWKKHMHIVAPSSWLAACVRNSSLMHSWPVSVIPHPLCLSTWAPVPKAEARSLLDLPAEVPIILFGALGAGKHHEPRKGLDLLMTALSHIERLGVLPDMQLVVVGSSLSDSFAFGTNIAIRNLGRIHDDATLRLVYSAASVFVSPSRQEAFGQTTAEAQACGTPVVAFRGTGSQDIISHKSTGYLSEYCSVEDLARGIVWVIKNSVTFDLPRESRVMAEKFLSPKSVAQAYRELYMTVATH